MATIYLAHITVFDPAIAGTRMLYLSSAGYTTGSAGLPPGGLAHTAYEPRIKQPANMRREMFGRGTTGGESTVGYGVLELTNIDGGLDDIATFGLDGQPITILVGEVRRGGPPIWTTVLVGTMEQPAVTWQKVSIRLRDRQAELDKPAAPNKYGGTNVLPAGLDGVAGDLKGKPKPRIFGRVFNIAPPCVNTSRLIYQINDGAVSAVSAVYVRGAALTAGSAYGSQAEMEANAPAAGQYRAWAAGGYIRLGTSPDGIVTADATQGIAVGNRTVAQLAQQIATGAGGIAAGDISAVDLLALDAKNSAEVGIWINDETCREVLDKLCESIGAWWGFDRLGKFRMSRLEEPAGMPVLDITADDILSIDRVPSNDVGRGVATWQVTLKYARFWTRQDSDVAGAVGAARRAELRESYRSVVASDAAIKIKHLLAPALEFETLLSDAGAAAAESTRRLNLYKADRLTVELVMAYDPGLIADLGDVVRVTLSRFGMGPGKLFVVLGIRPDLELRRLYLTLWG
ncbi:hypothetical protein [Azonexus sp.]|uniref:hypothetical protein n=1 Tax=Azonexus sp. TaxID=1872668 RepID=UPI0027B8FB97|nr:hypothetical protein [Azonexus sp.]